MGVVARLPALVALTVCFGIAGIDAAYFPPCSGALGPLDLRLLPSRGVRREAAHVRPPGWGCRLVASSLASRATRQQRVRASTHGARYLCGSLTSLVARPARLGAPHVAFSSPQNRAATSCAVHAPRATRARKGKGARADRSALRRSPLCATHRFASSLSLSPPSHSVPLRTGFNKKLRPVKPPSCVGNETDCALNIMMAGKMTQVLHLPASFEWPDNAGGVIDFIVHTHFTIAQIEIVLHNFRHAYAGDVSLDIITPWGATIELIHSEPKVGHCGEDHFGSKSECLNYCPPPNGGQLWSESDTDYQERILGEAHHGQDIRWFTKPGCNTAGGPVLTGEKCSNGQINCCDGSNNPYCNIKTTGIYHNSLMKEVQEKKAYGTWTLGLHDHFLRDIGFFDGAEIIFYPCIDWTCPGMISGVPLLGPPLTYLPHFSIELVDVPNQNGEFELFVDKEGKLDEVAVQGRDYDTALFYFRAPADGLSTQISYRVLLNCRPSWVQTVNITVSAAPPVATLVEVDTTMWNSAIVSWRMRRPEFESYLYINGQRIYKKIPAGITHVDVYKDLGVWLPNSTFTIFNVKLTFLGIEGPISDPTNTTTCQSWCNNCTGKGLSMGIPFYDVRIDRWFQTGPFNNFCFDCVKVTPPEWGPQVPKVYRNDAGNGICIDNPNCPRQYWEKWDPFIKNFICAPCMPCGKGKIRRDCWGLSGGDCQKCADVHRGQARYFYKDTIGTSTTMCTPCTECRQDWYADSPCTTSHDLTCSACPEYSHTASTGSLLVTSCFCAPGWYLFLDKCDASKHDVCLIRECRECGLGCQRCEQGTKDHHGAGVDTVCMKPFKDYYLMNFGVTRECGLGWVHTTIKGVDANNNSIVKYGEQCRKCQSCPPGQTRVGCANATLGYCVTCPPETFKLDYLNYDSECTPCTRCADGEWAELQCFPLQDRKCSPCASCSYGMYRVGCGAPANNLTSFQGIDPNGTALAPVPRVLGLHNPGPGTCSTCNETFFKSEVGDWTTKCSKCSICRDTDAAKNHWECDWRGVCAYQYPPKPEDVPAIPCGEGIRFKKSDIPFPCLGCDSCPWGSFKSTACDRTTMPPKRAKCERCVGCKKGEYRVNCGNNGTFEFKLYDSSPGTCLACEAGKFKDSDAAGSVWWDDGCRACSYCAKGRWTEKVCWAEADTTPCQNCGECTTGSYISSNCNETAPHRCSSCTLCPVGSQLRNCKSSILVGVGTVNESHLGEPGTCETCWEGFYKDWSDVVAWNGSAETNTRGQNKCVPCSVCPHNTYADVAKDHHCTSIRDVTACDACPNGGGCLHDGYYVSDKCNSKSDGGTNVGGPICSPCQPCPHGTYRVNCSKAAPHLGGGPGYCAQCPAGLFKEKGITGNYTDQCHGCTPCPAGLAPQSGYHCRPNADIVQARCGACNTCETGKYIGSACSEMFQVGCFSCATCPSGTYRPYCNATHPGECVTCKQGKFKSFEGGWDTECSTCRECAAGRFATIDFDCKPTANTKECTYCGKCDAMEYESSQCNASTPPTCAKCRTCVQGEYLAGCTGRSAGVCTPCPIYTFKTADTSGVTTDGCSACGVCSRNSFETVPCTAVQNVECTQCLDGSVSDGGGTATSPIECAPASGFFLTVDTHPVTQSQVALMSVPDRKSVSMARVNFVPCFGGCLACSNGYTCNSCPKGRALLFPYIAVCNVESHCISSESPQVTAVGTRYTKYVNATVCMDVHTCEEKTATYYEESDASCRWCTKCDALLGKRGETVTPCSERTDTICQVNNDTLLLAEKQDTVSADDLGAGFLLVGLSLFGVSTIVTLLALGGGALLFARYRSLRHAHKYSKGINLSDLHFGQANVNVATNMAVGSVVAQPAATTWKRKTTPLLSSKESQKESHSDSVANTYGAFAGVNAWSKKAKGGKKKAKAQAATGVELASTNFRRRTSGVEMANPMMRMRTEESSKTDPGDTNGTLRGRANPLLGNLSPLSSIGGVSTRSTPPLRPLAVPPPPRRSPTAVSPALSDSSPMARLRQKKAMMRRRSDAFEGLMTHLNEPDGAKEGVEESAMPPPGADTSSFAHGGRTTAMMRRRSDVFDGLMSAMGGDEISGAGFGAAIEEEVPSKSSAGGDEPLSGAARRKAAMRRRSNVFEGLMGEFDG